jgi:hypothetical protein
VSRGRHAHPSNHLQLDPAFDRQFRFFQEEGYRHLAELVVEEIDRLLERRWSQSGPAGFQLAPPATRSNESALFWRKGYESLIPI